MGQINNVDRFEKAYRTGNIPWSRKQASKYLVALIKEIPIFPCRTIDVGCGEGYSSIYLAKQGFDVVGIDFSDSAINQAINNAGNISNVKFKLIDCRNLPEMDENFDFVFENALFHHIPTTHRMKYLKGVNKILNQDGLYVSISFDNREDFIDRINKRFFDSSYGLRHYLTNREDLYPLFSRYFNMIESKKISLEGRSGNIFIMRKNN